MRICIIILVFFSLRVEAQLSNRQLTENLNQFIENYGLNPFQNLYIPQMYWETIDKWANGQQDTSLYFDYVRDTAEPTLSRLTFLALMQKYQKEATYRNLDIQLIRKLYLQAFSNKHYLANFMCLGYDYEHQLSFVGEGFIELKDAVVPDLYSYVDSVLPDSFEDRIIFYCQTSPRHGTFNSYQSCSMNLLFRITSISLPQNLSREEYVALFKTKIQAYCAERGIKLE